MKIGKSTVPQTAISTSDDERIVVRGKDLCTELVGHVGFSEYFFLLLTGSQPDAAQLKVLDAALVAIAEHGFVPSVQAARMTLAAAPDALQGAVAAGLLGCGSVILGASESAGRLLVEIDRKVSGGLSIEASAREVLSVLIHAGHAVPGYGHPVHKALDPRVGALFATAQKAGADQRFINIAQAVERLLPELTGKPLRLNVSAAIPAVLLGAGFPVDALKGVPILARTASLVAHLAEEMKQPAGFALSYQATREVAYTGAAASTAESGRDR